MVFKIALFAVTALLLSSCGSSREMTSRANMSDPILELNAYKIEASQRCYGIGLSDALGQTSQFGLTTRIDASKLILTKGLGAGRADVALTISQQSDLKTILGNANDSVLALFVEKYEPCMKNEMDDFFRTKGILKKIPTATPTKDSAIQFNTHQVTAYATGKSGNWLLYPVCVEIPSNSIMIPNTFSASIIKGDNSGNWQRWGDGIDFLNPGPYGPTKACINFYHQIHDQDRTLEARIGFQKVINSQQP